MDFNVALQDISNFSKLGIDNNIDFILGDCLEKLKDIPKNSIDLVVTDPPYFIDGLGIDWDKEKVDAKIKKAGAIGGLPTGMKFDPKQGIEFQAFYYKLSKELYRTMKPGAFFLSFSQPRLSHRMAVAMEDAGFEIRDMYAWHYTKKAQMKAFTQDHFVKKMDIKEAEKQKIIAKLDGRKTPQLRPQFETIVMSQKTKEGTFVDNWLKWETGLINAKETLNGKIPSTVMSVEKPIKDKYNCHLTVKPVRLMEHLIKIFSKQEQIVLDPFLGSGTTALAAVHTNRHCIGIEINEEYLKIAKQRINGE